MPRDEPLDKPPGLLTRLVWLLGTPLPKPPRRGGGDWEREARPTGVTLVSGCVSNPDSSSEYIDAAVRFRPASEGDSIFAEDYRVVSPYGRAKYENGEVSYRKAQKMLSRFGWGTPYRNKIYPNRAKHDDVTVGYLLACLLVFLAFFLWA